MSQKKPKQTIIGPVEGWAENTWYVVEVAMCSSNPIWVTLFYSGFLHSYQPGGYNEIIGTERGDISHAHYLRVIKTLISNKEMKDLSGNTHKMVAEVITDT